MYLWQTHAHTHTYLESRVKIPTIPPYSIYQKRQSAPCSDPIITLPTCVYHKQYIHVYAQLTSPIHPSPRPARLSLTLTLTLTCPTATPHQSTCRRIHARRTRMQNTCKCKCRSKVHATKYAGPPVMFYSTASAARAGAAPLVRVAWRGVAV